MGQSVGHLENAHINGGGNFELTAGEVEQFELLGIPSYQRDIAAMQFTMLDVGQQALIHDAALAQAAAVDKDLLTSPDEKHARLSRHSRLAELRRIMPGVEIMPTPNVTKVTTASANVNVTVPVPAGALLCRVTASYANEFIVNFQGGAGPYPGVGLTVETAGFFVSNGASKVFYIEGCADASVFSLNNATLSFEFWTVAQ